MLNETINTSEKLDPQSRKNPATSVSNKYARAYGTESSFDFWSTYILLDNKRNEKN